MNILNQKTYFPSFEFILYTFILLLVLIAVIKYEETKYTIERGYNFVVSENTERGDKLSNNREESIAEINLGRTQGKYEADIATFVLWGAVGLFLYWICSIIYKSFVNPFVQDVEESHFVHANKRYIRNKRLIWILSIILTFTLLLLTINIFTTVVLSYYTIVVYETTVSSVVILLFSALLTTLMVAVLRVGLNIIARTY